MTKNVKERIMALVLAFAVVFAGTASVSIEADAATPYMKKLGVKVGMKEGKTYSFSTQYAGIGSRNATWTLTELKKKNAKKKGYKQLSFVVTYQNDFQPSAAEVDQMGASEYNLTYRNTGQDLWYAVVDAASGLDIEDKNKVKVKVKSKELANVSNKFYGTNGKWANVASFYRKKVTVTYPEDYKDLCIGFGGGNVLRDEKTQADNDFWDGNTPFGKTTYYKNGKTNSKWMMVK